MKIKDKKTGKIEIVINKTSNSFEVTRSKLTEAGVNCTNWFTERDFKDQFDACTSGEMAATPHLRCGVQ